MREGSGTLGMVSVLNEGGWWYFGDGLGKNGDKTPFSAVSDRKRFAIATTLKPKVSQSESFLECKSCFNKNLKKIC